MLLKLVKYDLRSQRFLSSLLLLISLGGAVLSSILLQVLISTMESDENAFAAIAMLGSIMMLFFVILGTFLSASAVLLSVAIHYYKKTVSDEAYLTFTLPATAGQHLMSKMMSGSVWMLLSSLVIVVDVIIIILPQIVITGDVSVAEIIEYLGFYFELVFASELTTVFALIGYGLNALAMLLSQLALLYLSLTVGGIVVNKCKALLGAGIYLGADMVVSLIMQVITSVCSVAFLSASYDAYMLFSTYLSAVLYTAFAITCYQITRHLLENKLNLA